jgi:hypothetical protein
MHMQVHNDNMSLKVALETERGSHRRAAVEQEKRAKADLEARDTQILRQEAELADLKVYKLNKDVLEAQLASVQQQAAAALAEAEGRAQSTLRKLTQHIAYEQSAVAAAVAAKALVLRQEVEAAVVSDYTQMSAERAALSRTTEQLQCRVKELLHELNASETARSAQRRNLAIVREMTAHSTGR